MGSNEHAGGGPSHPETHHRNQMAEECKADLHAQKGRCSFRTCLEIPAEEEYFAPNPHAYTLADVYDSSVPVKKVTGERKQEPEARSRGHSSTVQFVHPDTPSVVMPGCHSTRQETKKRAKHRFARFRDRVAELTAKPVRSDISSAMESTHGEEPPRRECLSHFHPTRPRLRAMTMVY